MNALLAKQVTINLPTTATEEQCEVIGEFASMLVAVTADGGRKRAAGLKPSWKVDDSHWAAIFSHLNKRMHGEMLDPDSGVHTLVHLAWRALAIAYVECQTGTLQPVVTKPKAAPAPTTKSEVGRYGLDPTWPDSKAGAY